MTAQVGVDIVGQDQLSAVANRATASLHGLGGAAGVSGGAMSALSRVATGTGGALAHAGNQVKNLVSGPLGLLGLGAGLFSVGTALEKGISKAQSWGLVIEKLQGITHDSAESLSGLLAVTEKYGLSNDRLATLAGFTEKALGALAIKTGATAKFTTEYGFSVTDAGGKVKDFSTLLTSFADYWKNGAETPAIKAAAAAKLFGRGFADLVPVLNLGAAGIAGAEQQAQALGLTLTQDNVTALAQMRENTRQLGDAMGGLELQIGLALIPTLNDFARAATSFISTHRDDIVGFVNGLAGLAKTVAGEIGDIAGGIADLWNMVPPQIRDFLLQAAIGDRIVHFIFGVSPISLVVSGLESGVAKALGSGLASAGLGKLFVQPVFVTNPGFGGAGGNAVNAAETVAGGAAAGGGAEAAVGGGVLETFLGGSAASIIGGLAAAGAVTYLVGAGLAHLLNSVAPNVFNDPGGRQPPSRANPASTALPAGMALNQYGATSTAPSTANQREDRLTNQIATWDHGTATLVAALDRNTRADWLSKLEASWTKAGQTMHDKIKEAMAGLTGPNAAGAAGFLGVKLGNAGFGAGGYAQAETVLAELKTMTQSPAVVTAIHQIEGRLVRLKLDRDDLAAAEAIAQGSDPKNKKLDQLNALMTDVRDHGDRTTQKKLADVIDAVRNQKPPTVNVFVAPPSVTVSGYGSGGGSKVITGRTAVTYAGAGKAGGGTPDPNEPTLVGEEGPEISWRGVIYTAGQTRGMRGAGLADDRLDRLIAALEQSGPGRMVVAAYATARDTEAAANRRAALGPSRTRNGALATR